MATHFYSLSLSVIWWYFCVSLLIDVVILVLCFLTCCACLSRWQSVWMHLLWLSGIITQWFVHFPSQIWGNFQSILSGFPLKCLSNLNTPPLPFLILVEDNGGGGSIFFYALTPRGLYLRGYPVWNITKPNLFLSKKHTNKRLPLPLFSIF